MFNDPLCPQVNGIKFPIFSLIGFLFISILNYCKLPIDSVPSGIFSGLDHNLIVKLKDVITKLIKIPEQNFSFTFYKLYKYSFPNSISIFNKSNNKFEFTEMPRYTINLIKL